MNVLSWIILISVACMGITYVAFMPFLWFLKQSHKVSMLDMKGQHEEAYRLNQKLYRLANMPILGRLFGNKKGMLLSLSRQADKMGEFETAMEYARSGMENSSASSRMIAMQQIANLLRKQGKQEEANALEESAIGTIPVPTKSHPVGNGFATEVASTLSSRAILMINKGRFKEALAALDESAQVSAQSSRDNLLSVRVRILRLMGRYDEAVALQSSAPEQIKRFKTQLNSPGALNSVIRKEIDRTLELSEVAAILLLVQVCLEAGKTGAASEHYERLPASVPVDIAACCYAMGAWLDATKGEEAQARVRIAQTLAEPSPMPSINTEAQHYLANAYFALHDYSAAIDVWRKLIEASDENLLTQAELRAFLATAYARSERFDLARTEYEAVIATGFEEAVFTREARTHLARLKANDVIDAEPVRLPIMNR